MFPNMVRFIWQAEDWGRRKVELIEDEQLEQRDVDQVQITSMLIVDQHKAKNKQFTCIVQHDSSFDDQINVIPWGNNIVSFLYVLSSGKC
ncbi:hypothetical protein C0J50_3174 [Silurus asotus]|uniref:Uncharacterized protein n=1 Tax=Silurus asotus TaxID=30991 RepID=A0AAD5B3Q2_SILAS|nr:hypothetical protein C0J50_3174 [Silurus asotus]